MSTSDIAAYVIAGVVLLGVIWHGITAPMDEDERRERALHEVNERGRKW